MWDSLVPVLVFESKTRRIMAANNTAAALLKTTTGELKGRSVTDCVAPEERARLVASIGSREQRWGEVGPWQCVACDGSRFTAQIRFHQAIYEGVLVHIVLATAVVPMAVSRAAAASYGTSFKRAE